MPRVRLMQHTALLYRSMRMETEPQLAGQNPRAPHTLLPPSDSYTGVAARGAHVGCHDWQHGYRSWQHGYRSWQAHHVVTGGRHVHAYRYAPQTGACPRWRAAARCMPAVLRAGPNTAQAQAPATRRSPDTGPARAERDPDSQGMHGVTSRQRSNMHTGLLPALPDI